MKKSLQLQIRDSLQVADVSSYGKRPGNMNKILNTRRRSPEIVERMRWQSQGIHAVGSGCKGCCTSSEVLDYFHVYCTSAVICCGRGNQVMGNERK